MPTFVLMTKLSPELARDPRGRKKAGREWMQLVNDKCPSVRWLSHFALLGRYDFMDIYEAPDIETAHKVSALSREGGAQEAESWSALPYERYLKIVEEIEK